MSTFFANKRNYQNRKWQVIDAKGQTLGRLASHISVILMGKNRPEFTPHVETGDGVIVINAKDIRVTGNKVKAKLYKNFSGFPGGLRERTYERVMNEDPTFAIKSAVKGMLPRSPLGRKMLTHFLVYAGAEHPHQAQTVAAAAGKAPKAKKDKKVS